MICWSYCMLVWVATGWMVGVLLGVRLVPDVAQWCAVFSLFIAGALAIGGRALIARSWRVLLSCVAMVAGLAYCPPPPVPALEYGEITIAGRVKSVRFGDTDSRVELSGVSVVQTGWHVAWPDRRKAWVHFPIDVVIVPGDTIEAKATVRGVPTFRNRAPALLFSQERAPFRIRSTSWTKKSAGSAFQQKLQSWRQTVRSHLIKSFPSNLAGLARALCIGDPAIPRSTRSAFIASGLAHLLAVSGLHVALVAGAWVRIIRSIASRFGRITDAYRFACATGIPVALFYAAFCGGAPSAWRASITACIAWTMVLLNRRPNATKTTAAAIVLLSVFTPQILLKPAFLLSIAATSAIVSADFSTHTSPLRRATSISLRTFFATAPLVWGYFGHASPIALVSNIVLLPIGALLLVPSANLCTLGAFIPWLAGSTSLAFRWIAEVYLAVCTTLQSSGLDPDWPIATTSRLWLFCTIAVLCFIGIGRNTRTRFAVVFITVFSLFYAECMPTRSSGNAPLLKAVFFDVGQGDSTLLEFDNGQHMLVDAGTEFPDAAQRGILPYLAEHRIEKIDVLVMSHPHPDHYGGMKSILDSVEVTELWANRQATVEDPAGAAASLLRHARSIGVTVRYPRALCDDTHSFGTARVSLLWPCPGYDPAYHENDNSLVLRVETMNTHLLLSGDIERDAEAALLEKRLIVKTDVLKVPHHGSRTSSTQAFLNRLAPDIAVISSGAANRFGHPHAEVLKRYQAIAATVFQVSRIGAVTLETDGNTWKAEDRRGQPMMLKR